MDEHDTELVNNPWSPLLPARRVSRCRQCLRRRKLFVLWLAILIVTVTIVAILEELQGASDGDANLMLQTATDAGFRRSCTSGVGTVTLSECQLLSNKAYDG